MTTQTEEHQAEGQGKQDEGGEHGPTMGDLRKMVAETVEGALKPFMDKLGGSGEAGKEPEGSGQQQAQGSGGGVLPDIAGMVNDAITKALGDKERQSAEAEHAAAHQRIAEAETRPVQRLRRSKWLGNIWDK